MTEPDADWERRCAQLWVTLEDHAEPQFLALVDSLAAELRPGSAIGAFERASSLDSTGHPDLAVPLYRAALETGLTGVRRRRATIQLASSLRNLGAPQQAVDLLSAELTRGPDCPEHRLASGPGDSPDDGVAELLGAVHAFLALALTDVGREREAVVVALTGLEPHLPRYNRSVSRYTELLREAP